MKTEIQSQLESFAFKRSKPFCYSCYKEAPNGRCFSCGSDDLMRLVPGVGCEWGVDWVITHIVESELKSVNTEEAFEESVRSCYPEDVQVGWMKLDTVSVMKEMDPVSWSIARSEWESQEEEEGNLISFDNGSTYYQRDDVESLVAD